MRDEKSGPYVRPHCFLFSLNRPFMYQDIRISGYQDIRISVYQYFGISGYPMYPAINAQFQADRSRRRFSCILHLRCLFPYQGIRRNCAEAFPSVR